MVTVSRPINSFESSKRSFDAGRERKATPSKRILPRVDDDDDDDARPTTHDRRPKTRTTNLSSHHVWQG